jgi:three-Cys-motif partner protein
MPARKQSWGGEHTTLKADVVTEYVSRYGTALKNQGFTTSYVDAFAGPGWRNADGGMKEFGVAVKVLNALDPLERYVFGDKDPAAIASLRRLVDELYEGFEDAGISRPVPEFWCGDANELVARECDWVQGAPMRRAVMFLDPYGMQVRRASIERIAATGRIDLWVLWPINQALTRLMQLDGDGIEPGRAAAIDDLLGPDWRSRFYEVPGLFGVQATRVAGDREVRDFVAEVMRTICGPGTHRTGMPLYRNGQLAFWLAFACTNQKPAAYSLALKFADHIIRRAQMPR